MVSLTAQQRRVLDQLLHGATGRSRSKHLPQLKRMGYVDDRYRPTLRTWHEFGEWRYAPRIQIPQEWEVETWRHELLMVAESPTNDQYDPQGPSRWSTAKEFTFIFSIYNIMQFYRECLIFEQQYTDSHWTESLDYWADCDRENRIWSHIDANTLILEARRASIKETAKRWACPHIDILIYNWGEKLYRYHTMRDTGLHSMISYRYSLQRNFDELHRFLCQPGYDPQQMMYFARISID